MILKILDMESMSSYITFVVDVREIATIRD